jgi:hypothetical protein
VIYGLLFKASAETMLTIAADPKHLGAKIAITSVLHTWGSAMTHHPHIHMIVPGGGISLDGTRWISSRPRFFLPVRVLSRLFQRLFLQMLVKAHAEGRLDFFGDHADLADAGAFEAFLAPLRNTEWVVYAKAPFGGPEAVLAYLARYTHRVAISNRRLLKADANGVTFRVKDYRINGPERDKTMTLAPDEFIRRFLLHILPKGFHRIRHYGLLANGQRTAHIAKARELLTMPATAEETNAPETPGEANVLAQPCPCCGSRMRGAIPPVRSLVIATPKHASAGAFTQSVALALCLPPSELRQTAPDGTVPTAARSPARNSKPHRVGSQVRASLTRFRALVLLRREHPPAPMLTPCHASEKPLQLRKNDLHASEAGRHPFRC